MFTRYTKEEVKEFKQKINKAFAQLRRLGYEAKQGDDNVSLDKFVYYRKGNKPSEGFLNLLWSGDGKKIVEVLESNGIKTKWDGTEVWAITILLK